MMEENVDKIYYPCCREIGCEGILKILFNPDNFTINYECEKNEKHKGERIYYDTFDKFYIKQKNIIICSQCNSILENDTFFKCKKCNTYYCSSCFLHDEHIKKDITNLKTINSKKCKIHNKDLIKYCVN